VQESQPVPTANEGRVVKRLAWIAVLLLVGGVLLPMGAYLLGTRLAGPFSGPRGLASYLGTIYADAAAGRPLALLLILGPLCCAAIWTVHHRYWRRRRASTGDE